MRVTIVNLYTIFILGVFPFLMNDGFLDISKTKSDIFVFSTIVMFLFCILVSVIEKDWKWVFHRRNWFIYSTIILIGIITLLACDVQYAWTGVAGRYQGAVVYWAYCIAALCIINFGKWKSSYIEVLIMAASIVSLFAILNFYEVDILGTLIRIKENQRHSYISTIGNTNIFSAYLSVVLPVAIVKAIDESNLLKKRLYYISLVLLFGAVLASTCDSVYITLGVLFIALPFWCLHSYERRKRMSEVLLIFGVTVLAICILNNILKYPLVYVDGVPLHFSDIRLCIVMCVLFFLIGLCFRFTKKVMEHIGKKTWQKLWFCFVFVVGVIVVYVYITNVTFDKRWGTSRGFVWMQGWDFYMQQPWLRKLFGIGFDSILPVFLEFYGEEQTIVYGSVHYDNLHNEYFHYLVTTGLVGLLTYVVAMGKMLYSVLKNAKYSSESFAIAMAGLCYMMQAVINISMSSVTAIIMILLFAGLIINKESIKLRKKK